MSSHYIVLVSFETYVKLGYCTCCNYHLIYLHMYLYLLYLFLCTVGSRHPASFTEPAQV